MKYHKRFSSSWMNTIFRWTYRRRTDRQTDIQMGVREKNMSQGPDGGRHNDINTKIENSNNFR